MKRLSWKHHIENRDCIKSESDPKLHADSQHRHRHRPRSARWLIAAGRTARRNLQESDETGVRSDARSQIRRAIYRRSRSFRKCQGGHRLDRRSSLRDSIQALVTEAHAASLSHAFSGELQAVGVADQAIQDRVGESWITDEIMPAFDRNLAGDDRSVRLLEGLVQRSCLVVSFLGVWKQPCGRYPLGFRMP